MSITKDIRFRNLPQRDKSAHDQLNRRYDLLHERCEKHKCDTTEQEEHDRIKKMLDHLETTSDREVVDPLFVAVRDFFNANHNSGLLGRKVYNFSPEGIIRLEQTGPAPIRAVDYPDIVRIAYILGALEIDGVAPPRLHLSDHPLVEKSRIAVDPKDPANESFSSAFFAAYGEAQGSHELAELVLSILEDEGNPVRDKREGEVDTSEFARVMRRLRKKHVTAREHQLSRRVNECLDRIQSVGVDKPLKEVSIALPDLNAISDYQIQSENVKLMGAVICSAMFEELKVFQVVDKLVELAQNGMLPIGRGSAGETLYRYWRETPNRMSEAERRNFYAMAIGIPGGNAGANVNREFNDLWMRFVSSVSSLVRQKSTDELLRAAIPAAVGQQQVRKTARDLALNLSSHGYGMAVFYAVELQGLINTIIALLGSAEIKAAYGARDMWQVIDQVATLELGGARNSARYRTLATCGAIITAWLADNVGRYNQATSHRVIDVNEVLSLDPPTAGPKATTKPTDYDLVNACELWLADTATSDERIEELAQPREAPIMTSRPVQIPSIAREMLEQAGIPGLGMGIGMNHR